MKSFDVLDRATPIQGDRLLEASAGTGKTFSIEHIVVRLILEGEGIPLENILVVTFTKAATRDLNVRIRSNLESSLHHLVSEQTDANIPDYLLAILEQGKESVERAKRKLEEALFCFDRSQIFTIHSFCAQMLSEHVFEADYSLKISNEDSQVNDSELLQVIHDFLRTEIHPGLYTPEDIQLVLKQTKNNLASELLKIIQKGCLIPPNDSDSKSFPEVILRMARDCQAMINRYLAEEERMRHDDFLQCMLKGIQNPDFAQKIQRKYRAIVIDEFQDTDPVQWEIFRKLFKGPTGSFIYLVGDPKQSIYAFRQADIYTYLSAADSIDKERHASLDTNYRSRPSLVEALNTLFNPSSCPGFMDLPASGSHLEYPPVKSPSKSQDRTFSDALGSIHFFIAEGKTGQRGKFPVEDLEDAYFFPYMVREILRLNQKEGILYKQMAVLIKDRFQGERFARFCKGEGIPVHLQRKANLSDSIAYEDLRELLQAVIHVRDRSLLKIALGGHLIGWIEAQIGELRDESSLMEKIVGQFQALRRTLLTEGFAPFFQQFLQTSWHRDGRTVAERLLLREGGEEVYDDLLQISDLLTEYQAGNHTSPEGLIGYLDEFPQLEGDEESAVKRKSDPNRDALQVLTMHSSKGLEYEIVFTLGLINRNAKKDTTYPQRKGTKQVLVPVADSSEYKLYLRENDAEKMRQLYVAMTRAKYRVYVPVAVCSGIKELDPGRASPLDLFLAKLGQPPALDVEELYKRIVGYKIDQLISFIEQHPCHISYSRLNELTFDKCKKAPLSEPSLLPPPQLVVPGSQQMMLSYTALAKRYAGRVPDGEESYSAPIDFYNPMKNIHTLPSGIETGLLLHTLFEKLPFDGSKEEWARLMDPFVDGTKYQKWKEVLLEILQQTLNAPLIHPEGSFCLRDIDLKKVYREMEFLFPCPEGYMKGVIDLIFEHQGKYYIVDWKSNWLGPDNTYYQRQNLEIAMEQHHYHLQSQLYRDALSRYLKIVDKDAPIGDVFYLFVRGLSNGGVYSC